MPRVGSLIALATSLAALMPMAVPQVAPSGDAVQVLRSIGGLPAHVANRFEQPIAFAATSTGDYLVLDRRAHTVTLLDRNGATVKQTITIGFETGRVLSPTALAVGANDMFAVADAPNRYERIQYFSGGGQPIDAFFLDSTAAPRVVFGPLILNGVGSLQFTGSAFLLNRPESGALVTELNMNGQPVRRLGALRATGHEADRDLHLAMNVGLPLVDPTGGFYFVFRTGVPMFRKYDAGGQLLFERHIEGVELDEAIQALPTTWPRRTGEGGGLPMVTPLLRTAAVDRQGRLWVSLVGPFTYVYDRRGDRMRTVQFHGAGLVAPDSLFFAADGRLLVTPGCYEFDSRAVRGGLD